MNRDAIYAGEVMNLGPTEASRRLVAGVTARLTDVLGASPRDVRLSDDELFRRVGILRRELYLDRHWHDAIRDVLAPHGFGAYAFDPLRLRVVLSDGHDKPAAAPVYYPHRDTWYAHPQALIAWWIPLDDLADHETFVFYPERFAQAVPNDSEIFDYDDWVRDGWELKIGWQVPAERARYPHAAAGVDRGRAVGFACRSGDNVVFAGAQFHATKPQSTGRTRFSLDFRVVDLDDHASGRGAPNVDNRSRGSALRDYVR